MPRKRTEKGSNDHFNFSDDQKARLRQVLNKYENNANNGLLSNINQFINELEIACSLVDDVSVWQKYRDNQTKIDDLRKYLRKALKIMNPSAIDSSGKIKTTEETPFKISAYPQTYYYETQAPAYAEILKKEQEFWKRANDAIVPIMNLLALLDDSRQFMEGKKRRKGQLPADYDGFFVSVAEAFQRHLGEKPTSYGDGPFVGVARIVLEALGRPSDFPDRTIRAAIEKLKVKDSL